MLTERDLIRVARDTGFRRDVLEQVIRLLELLELLHSHPFLKSRIALKGGTALNLFILDVPRLSLDADLNYIGSPDRDTMLAERPQVERAIDAVCGRLDIEVRRVPGAHAGGKCRLSYRSVSGGRRSLELDLNYVLRTPLWPKQFEDSRSIGGVRATGVAVLDLHELAAGKLAALLARDASRDLFDARELLRRGGFDRARLRTAFVVYGAASRVDWRTVGVDHVTADPAEVDGKLVPVLRVSDAPDRAAVASWTQALIADCRDLLSAVLPLEANELEFLDRLNDAGEVAPELLTDDPAVQDAIRAHPGLAWKAVNVKRQGGR